MTDEEKLAEEYFKTTYPSYIGFDTFTRDIEDAVIYGLKAGGTKWHRVADGDLPPIETGCCSIDVLIDRGRFAYYCYDNNCWFDSDTIDKIDPPKAWCEIPTYTEV